MFKNTLLFTYELFHFYFDIPYFVTAANAHSSALKCWIYFFNCSGAFALG